MKLVDISGDDLDLYRAQLLDPVMMAELGGPLPPEGIEPKLLRDVAGTADGRYWALKIVPDDLPGIAVGTISVWDYDEDGELTSEIGWMVLPQYQGRGYASRAVHTALARARFEGRWNVLHAYPGADNGGSNAICRKCGFTLIGEREVEFAGRMLNCNHWRIDLTEPTS